MKTELSNFQFQMLSPMQLQSLNILSMNALELSEYLKEVQLENPFIEYDAPTYINFRLKNSNEKKYKESEIYNYYNNEYPDLREYLISQLDLYGISKFEYKLLDILISYLNENGYLEINADKLSILAKCDKSLAEDAIAYLQSLEPAGIAASNLEECLKIQLRRKGCLDITVYEIIDSNLIEIGNNQLKKIAAIHDISVEKAIEYTELIRSLNPKPASAFGNETSRFIDPDVFITTNDNTISYELNTLSFPHCWINNYYIELKDYADEETKEYINSKLTQVNYIIKSVQNRIKTFENIINLIIQSQHTFFLYGHNLIPMTLENAANVLNIHKSTMGRAIRGKYLECAFGLFPLKSFFESTTYSDQTPSTIKNIIIKLIEAEDKNNPLSDENISTLIKEKGINITRRTVANYRTELNIPNSSIRKINK